jgi:hypothetical protein
MTMMAGRHSAAAALRLVLRDQMRSEILVRNLGQIFLHVPDDALRNWFAKRQGVTLTQIKALAGDGCQ